MSAVVEVTTGSADDTRRLGYCMGRQFSNGAVLRLSGDLGSGKTCFVQGLARGLAVHEAYDITSPTFTLINQYPGRLFLVHVDLYRLSGTLEADAIGLWDLCQDDAVVAVEWAERLPDDEWPADALRIRFDTPTAETRRIRLFSYGLEQDYLIRGAVDLWKR